MKYPIIIKRSALALIRNIIIAELAAFLFLFFSTFLANYQKVYSLAFNKIIRYDYFLIIATSLFQLVITLIVFLKWHNEQSEIREKEITMKKGIFSVSQNSLPLKNIESINYKQNLFERLTNCGTVVIRNSTTEKPVLFRNIENAEIISATIKSLAERAQLSESERTKKLSVLDIILNAENRNLEFKQTFRWDVRQKIVNRSLEKAVMKSIASFLNFNGGNLIIGLADNKTVFGLEQDYKTLDKQNRDGFENHFNNIFHGALGARFREFVKLRFETLNDREVCLVEALPSDGPVYLKANNSEEFYIRTGNSATPLTMSETADYIKSRWGEV